MRARFFGPEASTARTTERARRGAPAGFRTAELDIRDAEGVLAPVRARRRRPRARHPHRGAAVARLGRVGPADRLRRQRHRHAEPARGDARRHARSATFIFTSTNKVYGDTPNRLPLEDARRAARAAGRTTAYFGGIDTTMSIDGSMHSLFGASKVAGGRDGAGVRPLLRHADRLLPRRLPDRPAARAARSCTASSRYLMRARSPAQPYTVFGYEGKQVRDNIHCDDVVRAFEAFHRGAARGGGLQPRRRARVQLLDARGDRRLRADLRQDARLDATPTRTGWATTAGGSATSRRSGATIRTGSCAYDLETTLREIHDFNVERWLS